MAGAVRTMDDKVTLKKRLVNKRMGCGFGFGFGFGFVWFAGSFPLDNKTIFFNKEGIPVKFIMKLPGVLEIIFLHDEQGIFDLTDLEQQKPLVVKEADLIPAGSR